MKKLLAFISTFIIALAMAFQFPTPLPINAATEWPMEFYWDSFTKTYSTSERYNFKIFNSEAIIFTIEANEHCLFYKDTAIGKMYASINFYVSQVDLFWVSKINLIDIYPGDTLDGTYAFNFSDFDIDPSAFYFEVIIPTDLTSHDNTTKDLLDTSTWENSLAIDTYRTNFYSGLSLYYWHILPLIYSPIMPLPDPTKKGYTFTEWRTYTGEAYDLDHVPTGYDIGTYFINGDTLNLYAVFTNDDTNEEFVGNSPAALQTALAQLGLWNDTGKIFIYLIVLLLLLIPSIVWLKLDKFILTIISMIITILFAFIGLLPIYVTIISMAIYLLFLFLSLKGSDQ